MISGLEDIIERLEKLVKELKEASKMVAEIDAKVKDQNEKL